MNFHTLDVVVLIDFPAQGLKRGDLGAVVDVYSPDAMEVEFVTASGRPLALITLRPSDIREVGDDDLVACVRPVHLLFAMPDTASSRRHSGWSAPGLLFAEASAASTIRSRYCAAEIGCLTRRIALLRRTFRGCGAG